MIVEAHAQRKQNFTCTMTKGSLKLSKKSPSGGRGDARTGSKNEETRANQIRERSLGSKGTKMVNFQTHQNQRVVQSSHKSGMSQQKSSGQQSKNLNLN